MHPSSILANRLDPQPTRTKDEDEQEEGLGHSANQILNPGLNPGPNGAKLRVLWDDQLLRRGWRTQLKVSTREGKAGRRYEARVVKAPDWFFCVLGFGFCVSRCERGTSEQLPDAKRPLPPSAKRSMLKRETE